MALDSGPTGGGSSDGDDRTDTREETETDSTDSSGSTSSTTDGPNDGRGREAPDFQGGSDSGGGDSSEGGDGVEDSSPGGRRLADEITDTPAADDGDSGGGSGQSDRDADGGSSAPSSGPSGEDSSNAQSGGGDSSMPNDGPSDGRGREAPSFSEGDSGADATVSDQQSATPDSGGRAPAPTTDSGTGETSDSRDRSQVGGPPNTSFDEGGNLEDSKTGKDLGSESGSDGPDSSGGEGADAGTSNGGGPGDVEFDSTTPRYNGEVYSQVEHEITQEGGSNIHYAEVDGGLVARYETESGQTQYAPIPVREGSRETVTRAAEDLQEDANEQAVADQVEGVSADDIRYVNGELSKGSQEAIGRAALEDTLGEETASDLQLGEDFTYNQEDGRIELTPHGQQELARQSVEENYAGGSLEAGEDFEVQYEDGEAVVEFTEAGRETLSEDRQDLRAAAVAATSGEGELARGTEASEFAVFSDVISRVEEQVEAENEGLEAGEDFNVRITEDGGFSARVTEERQEELQQQARERRKEQNEAFAQQLEDKGYELDRAEAQTGRDLDQDGSVTKPDEYLAQEFQESTPYDLERGEDFRVVETEGEDGTTLGVEFTESGLATVEERIEEENPAADVEVTQENGIQIERQEQFGDIDWTPFVAGDPVEDTVDSATATVSKEIDKGVAAWKDAGGPTASLYAASPTAMFADTTMGTNFVDEESQAAATQFTQTSAEIVNVPGYASGGMEAVEAGAYAAGGVDNAAALASTGVAVGEDAAEWAAENPNKAAGGGLALAGSFVVGSAAETAAVRRLGAVTGRRIPTATSVASMTFDQFKSAGSTAATTARRAGSRARSAADTARARTPSVRLEKDPDTGVVSIDESAGRQLRDEARVSQRQLRDAQDRARRRASSDLPTLEDVRDRAAGARSRVDDATPDREQLPGRDDLPGPSDLPSPEQVSGRVRQGARSVVDRPVGRASDLSRRIRREATSTRFKVAEMVRRERQASLRERARARAREELTNAQFALSETIDGIERPNVRDRVPSREDAVAMASQRFDDVVRRGRMEAKNLEFRAAGVRRGAGSTLAATRERASQTGSRVADASRRLVSEARDLDEYGIRITASDEYLDAQRGRPRAEFDSEDLVDNVDETGSNLDPVGQLEDIEEGAGAANAADDAFRADDAAGAGRRYDTERSGSDTGSSTRTRVRSGDQRSTLLKRERGPLARDTPDQRRTRPDLDVGLTGASVATATLASDMTDSDSMGVLEEAQSGALGAVDANAIAGAQERLAAAQSMEAFEQGGLEQYNMAAFDAPGRVEPGMDVGLAVDVGIDTNQATRLDQGTRLRLENRLRADAGGRAPRGPDIDFRPQRNAPDRGPADPTVAEIEYVNAVASSSEAFFGGFDTFRGMGGGGGFEGTGSGSRELEEVDVMGGEL